MKILAIGDFHGKFPGKFEKIIKKEITDNRIAGIICFCGTKIKSKFLGVFFR